MNVTESKAVAVVLRRLCLHSYAGGQPMPDDEALLKAIRTLADAASGRLQVRLVAPGAEQEAVDVIRRFAGPIRPRDAS
jgi:hypothetical protein